MACSRPQILEDNPEDYKMVPFHEKVMMDYERLQGRTSARFKKTGLLLRRKISQMIWPGASSYQETKQKQFSGQGSSGSDYPFLAQEEFLREAYFLAAYDRPRCSR